MFRFAPLLRGIEQRARHLHGLSLGAIALGTGGVVALGVAGFYHFGFLTLNRYALSGALGSVLLCSGLFYLLGRKREVDLPRLLLQIDLALGTGERLCSLYELRRRGGGRAFRRRIEESLGKRPLKWKKGLPVGPSHLVPFVGGILTLLAAFLLIALSAASPLDHITEEPPALVRVSRPEARAVTSPSEVLQIHSEGGESRPDSFPQPKTPPSHGLEDPLSEVWEVPAAGGLLMDEMADLTELLEEQHTLSRALSELLSRIEERLQHDGGGLTEEERRALSDLAQQVGSAPLRRALRELLEEEDPQALQEGIEQALNLTQTLADTSDGGPPPEASGGPSSPADEGEGEQGFVWESQERGEGFPEPGPGASTEKSEKDVADAASPDQDQSPLGGDEERFGGEAGIAGEVGPTTQAPGFSAVDLAGAIGSQGDFQEFLTKGVPLEQDPGPEKEAGHFSVDYETLRALLEGRAIPTEAQEMVRMYFQMITQQGGP
ncbi:hypothetical protein KAX17_03495 [Candidatus Bipolaricaulota bacterium]|nr:hypothetical protein [Candidatus Bipolaricaulota bacterium]